MKSTIILFLPLLLFSNFSFANGKPPLNFLFVSSGDLSQLHQVLLRKNIEGVQIVYSWKELEVTKDNYNFSSIEKDLKLLSGLHRKLFIQIQDRFFDPNARNIPCYLLQEKVYKGGLVRQIDNPGEDQPKSYGWVTMQWNPAVQLRYQKLLAALARQFDGRIYGINLPETSIDIDMKHDNSGFSCEKYFQAEIDNMKFAAKAFRKSYVVQYVNFFPCEWNNDHQYMSRLFDAASQSGVGLGGPDVVPDKKAQMKNAYPFFNQYKGKLKMIAMAVQEPTLTYKNPKTKKPFTKKEFVQYSKDFLGADIIFWSIASPWLQMK